MEVTNHSLLFNTVTYGAWFVLVPHASVLCRKKTVLTCMSAVKKPSQVKASIQTVCVNTL